MFWGISLLLKENLNNKKDDDRLFEENIILISAETEEDARIKAIQFGNEMQTEYHNIDGENVSWVFDGVFGIYPIIDKIDQDGSTVFSRHLIKSEVDSIKRKFKD
jgi:hypothetical protein